MTMMRQEDLFELKHRVLVVEDADSILLAIKDYFVSYFETAAVATCEEAEKAILESVSREKPFDLAIVDIHLPDKSGLDLIGFIGVVIGECALGGNATADIGQGVEEFPGPADAGEGDHRLAGKLGGLIARLQVRMEDRHRTRWILGVCDRLGDAGTVMADHHHPVGAPERGCQGLAQGAGGQQTAIAQAITAIDHDKGDVLGQTRILQAVI